MNITGWLNQLAIPVKMTCEPEAANPHMLSDEKWSLDANHWKCTLSRGKKRMTVHFSRGKKRMTVHFSQGSGHRSTEPRISSVLSSLALDAQSYENTRDFEDWAGGFDLDADSRKAEKMYKLVGQEAKKLKSFLGATLTQQLLYDVELD